MDTQNMETYKRTKCNHRKRESHFVKENIKNILISPPPLNNIENKPFEN